MFKEINIAEAIALLNAGGWIYEDRWVSAQNTIPHIMETRKNAIVEAVVADGILTLKNARGEASQQTVSKLSFAVNDDAEPDTLDVTVTSRVKQQRPKHEGGDFFFKDQVSRHRYLNFVAFERIRERERQEMELRLQREEEEREAARKDFVSRQKKRIGQARVADLSFGPGVVTIKFNNGYELKVELAGDEDFEQYHLEIDWHGEKD